LSKPILLHLDIQDKKCVPITRRCFEKNEPHTSVAFCRSRTGGLETAAN